MDMTTISGNSSAPWRRPYVRGWTAISVISGYRRAVNRRTLADQRLDCGRGSIRQPETPAAPSRLHGLERRYRSAFLAVSRTSIWAIANSRQVQEGPGRAAAILRPYGFAPYRPTTRSDPESTHIECLFSSRYGADSIVSSIARPEGLQPLQLMPHEYKRNSNSDFLRGWLRHTSCHCLR